MHDQINKETYKKSTYQNSSTLGYNKQNLLLNIEEEWSLYTTVWLNNQNVVSRKILTPVILEQQNFYCNVLVLTRLRTFFVDQSLAVKEIQMFYSKWKLLFLIQLEKNV